MIRTLSIVAAIRVYDENSASLPWALSALQFPKGQAYVEYIPHPQCAVKPHVVKFWNEEREIHYGYAHFCNLQDWYQKCLRD